MKAFLLAPFFIWLSAFSGLPLAPQPHTTTLTVSRTALFNLMMKELEPARLRVTYKSDFKVKQVSKNRYEPTVKDTLLAVTTAADQILLFTNKYNTFVTKAVFTSNKVAFGKNIRVGASKEAFCRAFKLSVAYTHYRVTDDEGAGTNMEFFFSGGILRKVHYQIGYME